MMLVEETNIPQGALPVAHFKDHLRLGTGFDETSLQDSVLESFLSAAMAAIEARTGKILMARGFSWTLSAWRGADEQALPVAPVQAITELIVATRLGDETVIDADAFTLVQDMQRPKIKAAGILPVIPMGGVAKVSFDAGFGPDWADLPSDLAQAVLMLAAHYYEYRHETALGGGCMPFGVTALIERYRTVRLMGGGRS